MSLKLMNPLIETFELIKVDEKYAEFTDGGDDATLIEIRQATQREHEKRASVFNRISRTYSQMTDSTVREIQDIPWTELTRKEVFLTLAGCNIEDRDGSQLFLFKDGRLAMTFAEFTAAWGKLPPFVCQEMHKHVYDVNIAWSNAAKDMDEAVEDGLGTEVDETVPLASDA